MQTKLKTQCKLGVLTRPDGSALFCEGETTVIAGVYGPVEIKAHKALVDKASVEAHFRPKADFPGVKDRLHESIIKNVCEAVIAIALYPRTSVIVVVQEMQNGGSLISCALNAACLAALNSGIDMRCMFAAMTCFLGTTGTLGFIPPINKDEIKASFMFVFDSVARNVIGAHTEGSFDVDQYRNALDLCRAESVNIFEFYKRSIVQ